MFSPIAKRITLIKYPSKPTEAPPNGCDTGFSADLAKMDKRMANTMLKPVKFVIEFKKTYKRNHHDLPLSDLHTS